MTANAIQLPQPTNRTAKGPRYRSEGQRIVVEYDYEPDGGSLVWSEVAFDEVLTFSFKQVACCHAADIVSSTEVAQLNDSTLLRDTIARWQESVGWQEWQTKQGGMARFKHFKMFFDEAGCIDVVAAACTLLSPQSIKSD